MSTLPPGRTAAHGLKENGIPVKLPSGAVYYVLTKAEQEFFEERSRSYTDVFKFTNVSDLASLDQVLEFELLIHRYNTYLSLGKDWHGEELLNEGALRREVKGLSDELRQIKAALKIDKKGRDNDTTNDVATRWEELRIRAREFGVMRDEQVCKAVELANHLIALYEMYERSDEQERQANKCHPQDLVDWVRDVFIPEFQAIDAAFREGRQKIWMIKGS